MAPRFRRSSLHKEAFSRDPWNLDSRIISSLKAIDAVNELSAHFGVIYTLIQDERIRDEILVIQSDLVDLCNLIANASIEEKPPSKKARTHVENMIDFFSSDHINEMQRTPIISDSLLVNYIYLARAVCKRAEHAVIFMQKDQTVNQDIMLYLSRLSNLLFLFARFITMIEAESHSHTVYQ